MDKGARDSGVGEEKERVGWVEWGRGCGSVGGGVGGGDTGKSFVQVPE